jgi:hypothetical protein
VYCLLCPFCSLCREYSDCNQFRPGRLVLETSLRLFLVGRRFCRLGRHFLRSNDDRVISGSPCTCRYVRNSLLHFFFLISSKPSSRGNNWLAFCRFDRFTFSAPRSCTTTTKLWTAQCAYQHEVWPNQLLDEIMERDNMESQQPPQAQQQHFPARPLPYPHARSQYGVLQALPTQLGLRTANTTPASSPGPFSPPNPRPSMFAPSVSEGSTPGPGAGSPLLHPLQHHKVRE